MISRWKFDIESLENYRIGEDKSIYRLESFENKRTKNLRKIKFDVQNNRVKLNGKFWSLNVLRRHIIDDPDPIQLFKTNDIPF